MKYVHLLNALLVAACLGFAACESTATTSVDDASALTLCGDCGQFAGSPACCAEDAEVCACGLAKGSPGCCKMEPGADVELCAKCGMIEGVEGCCDEGATHCADCGLIAGSPACCKIE